MFRKRNALQRSIRSFAHYCYTLMLLLVVVCASSTGGKAAPGFGCGIKNVIHHLLSFSRKVSYPVLSKLFALCVLGLDR